VKDNTDFVFVISVEQLSANVFFDGLDSGADTENVTITSQVHSLQTKTEIKLIITPF
jgi:hypothetical protein